MRRIFIDCPQEIPCNPCVFSCAVGAITINGPLTARPKTYPEKCIGCSNCVAACPGQACFLIDEDYSDTLSTIDFPYEFLPLPNPGDFVDARDNEGNTICRGQIVEVIERPAWSGTRVIRLAVPKSTVFDVRGIRKPC